VDKFRFKIQSRNSAVLSLFTTRQVLELVFNESLVKMYQSALAINDATALCDCANHLREQVAHKLQVVQSASPGITSDLIYID
jgi:hypothetical protein